MNVELLTSDEDFDDLHAITDKRKKTVSADRQKLLNLLIDHTKMVNALAQRGCKVTTPAHARTRVRIHP